jgi:hypothetical protein
MSFVTLDGVAVEEQASSSTHIWMTTLLSVFLGLIIFLNRRSGQSVPGETQPYSRDIEARLSADQDSVQIDRHGHF